MTKGATTIWERWDGIRPDGSFQTVGMNSFNHYAYGAIGEWLYSFVAGIAIDENEPGYKHILIRPHPGGGLAGAKASIHSVYGKIATDWKIEDGTFNLDVTIPANTTATVYVPAEDIDAITESGGRISEAKGIQFLRIEQGCAVFAVGSGQYEFVSKLL